MARDITPMPGSLTCASERFRGAAMLTVRRCHDGTAPHPRSRLRMSLDG